MMRQGLPLSPEQHIEVDHEKSTKLCAVRGYNSMCKESVDLEVPKHEQSVARQIKPFSQLWVPELEVTIISSAQAGFFPHVS